MSKPLQAVTDDAAAGNEEGAPAARWSLAGLALSALLSSLGGSIANVALPTLALAFGASFQQVQWIVLAYLLTLTATIVGVGRLGDVVGRRRLLLAGLGWFTLATALGGLAPSLGVLIAARAAQGLGAAAMLTLTLALVGEAVPRSRAGSAMGLLGTMSAAGTALGPSLGGLLIAGFGWRALFVATVPLGLLTLLLAHRHLPADAPRPKPRPSAFDPAGTLLLALTLAAYAFAMTAGRGHFGPVNAALLLAAACAGGLFALVEASTPTPLIRLALLRDPGLRAGLATSALVSTVMMATLVVGPFYLGRGLGLDPARVGLLLAVGPLVAALCGVPAGRLVDRHGARRTTRVGLAVAGAGCLLVSVLPAALGPAGYLAPIVVVTAGYALFQAANNTAVMAGLAPERRGLVSSLLILSRNLGLTTGASAMGAIFAAASGTSDVSTAPREAVAAGMRVTFVAAAGLVALALALAMGKGSEGAFDAAAGPSAFDLEPAAKS
ncbi:MAG: MFS transporter [Vicinamibacteria bacterium]|nr:MFS transporter [Vicinamibacteria bacterium]